LSREGQRSGVASEIPPLKLANAVSGTAAAAAARAASDSAKMSSRSCASTLAAIELTTRISTPDAPRRIVVVIPLTRDAAVDVGAGGAAGIDDVRLSSRLSSRVVIFLRATGMKGGNLSAFSLTHVFQK
jgi:hypothetical protein